MIFDGNSGVLLNLNHDALGVRNGDVVITVHLMSGEFLKLDSAFCKEHHVQT